jgi:hypothetical protein
LIAFEPTDRLNVIDVISDSVMIKKYTERDPANIKN